MNYELKSVSPVSILINAVRVFLTSIFLILATRAVIFRPEISNVIESPAVTLSVSAMPSSTETSGVSVISFGVHHAPEIKDSFSYVFLLSHTFVNE